MDVLKVVQQLRDLAREPQNRVTIIKDQGCLPGLILFLDNGDDRVVLTALEALQYLAQLPSNRPTMKKELGMLVSLRTLVNRTGANPEVRKMAQTVHDMLVVPATTARPLSQSRVAGKGNVFLGASNKRAKIILLQIHGLDANTRPMVEEQLLTVKGIISFTFDMSHRRCTVRGRADLKPQSLCEAIAKTGILNAEQVVRNEQGEEVFLTFGTVPAARSGVEKENSTPIELPGYLPEELDPEKSKKAVVTTDSGDRGGGGWFTSVGNFLAKSFYW